jgi:hypothetical protein
MDARVRALLECADKSLFEVVRPCEARGLIKTLRKVCGIGGSPNERVGYLQVKPMVRLARLFKHCISLSYFPEFWKEAKLMTFPKVGKDPRFSQNLRQISLLSTTDKPFGKVILKIVQRHIDERDLLHARQFGVRACYSTTSQCVSLEHRVTPNFKNNLPMAGEFLQVSKAFDTTRHCGLLYRLLNCMFRPV